MSVNYINPYYYPEEMGLEIVAVVSRDDLSYEYDMFVIWKDAEAYYWADDSGCSCPSPFEDYTEVEKLFKGNLKDALIDLDAWASYHKSRLSAVRRSDVIRQLREI